MAGWRPGPDSTPGSWLLRLLFGADPPSLWALLTSETCCFIVLEALEGARWRLNWLTWCQHQQAQQPRPLQLQVKGVVQREGGASQGEEGGPRPRHPVHLDGQEDLLAVLEPERRDSGGASGQVLPLPVCSCVCQLVLAAFPPAALHLLQSQQVHREQARHPLAAPLRLRANVQLEGADVT